MKKIGLVISCILLLTGLNSCKKDDPIDPGFEDVELLTIYDYIVENDSLFSSFLKILEAGGIDKTVSAYNPDAVGYTCFLPDNNAIDEFIADHNEFNSLEDILSDSVFVYAFSRFHIVKLAIDANDFPFGALPAYTMSGDLLTVSFFSDPDQDTSYYLINNQAPLYQSNKNKELSNGFVHIISKALTPITFTTYDWISSNPGYTIFKQAVDETGWAWLLDNNTKDEESEYSAVTLFLEPDSVYNRRGIYNFDDLVDFINPLDNNYEDPENYLNVFVGYHILSANNFLDDFAERASNYNTFADIPVNVNGMGIDLKINPRKEIFDTLVINQDTTIIDYVGFYYDDSNVLTQTGALHLVDQVLRQQVPSRADQTFEFYEEQLFTEFRLEPGEYLIEDSTALTRIRYSGSELYFIESADEDVTAWGDDYIQIEGDFKISYTIPKIVQGKYVMILGAHFFSDANALIEVTIDGKPIGGLVDLRTSGSANFPFRGEELGIVDFQRYSEHTIEISSLIPGKFLWDYIRFEIDVN